MQEENKLWQMKNTHIQFQQISVMVLLHLKLATEIKESVITIALLKIDVAITAPDNCDIWFKDVLPEDSGDDQKAILDGLVSSHDGIALTGTKEVEDKTQITSSNPTVFSNIAINGKSPKKLETIAKETNVLMIDALVPTGKKWFIHAWDGSGQQTGFFLIEDWYDGEVTPVTIDNFDDVSGWSINEKTDSVTLNNTEQTEGTGCLEWELSDSHKNTDKARIEKTYSPVLDLSTTDEISFMVKGPGNEKGFSIKLYSGANSYLFSNQVVEPVWTKMSFPLSEVIANAPTLNLASINKIELFIYANGVTETNDTYYVDLSEQLTGVVRKTIDHFFNGMNNPHQHLFPLAIPFEENHHIRVYVENNSNASATYEVGFNGREITL